jgi:hypothetical protein
MDYLVERRTLYFARLNFKLSLAGLVATVVLACSLYLFPPAASDDAATLRDVKELYWQLSQLSERVEELETQRELSEKR